MSIGMWERCESGRLNGVDSESLKWHGEKMLCPTPHYICVSSLMKVALIGCRLAWYIHGFSGFEFICDFKLLLDLPNPFPSMYDSDLLTENGAAAVLCPHSFSSDFLKRVLCAV